MVSSADNMVFSDDNMIISDNILSVFCLKTSESTAEIKNPMSYFLGNNAVKTSFGRLNPFWLDPASKKPDPDPS
jgi:hypothetical protein